jgi:putative FmdB family regulatory protein
MPTYEYVCKSCGENFEVFQAFSARPLKKHGEGCGGELQKIFHARGVLFKGSGFYKTDSRVSSGSNGKSDKSDKASTAKSENGKSDAKTKTSSSKESSSTSSSKESSSTSSSKD